MSLNIANNMMAANTARILSNTYDRLSTSVQRLSSGLRINSAADDAAGLAIRELMRADILTMQQGIRNAADGISMLQTAEGAMAVIDEKLVRMKELAEQAATGTYTTVQREIINSEYQAMAAEIDRIAVSTNFNGVKLLDGSISSIHQGQGMKLHFGTGNDPAQAYYFINMGDVRATSQTGLRIGGDAKNDIWGTVNTHTGPNANGCCGGGIPSLNEPVPDWKPGEVFSFGYNWDWKERDETLLNTGRYIAGAWQVDSTPTLQELMDMVNKGTQARVRIDFEHSPAKYTLFTGSAYANLDLAAWSAQLSTTCGIDRNYRVTGYIEVTMSVSAKTPAVCFGDGPPWPPTDLFAWSATGVNPADSSAIGTWVLVKYGFPTASAVTFSGFTRAEWTSGDGTTGPFPNYTIWDTADPPVGRTIYWSGDTETPGWGSGLSWSATAVDPVTREVGQWVMENGEQIYVTGSRGRDPVFVLSDGQIVPPSFVQGNSIDGFQLKLGTHVVKTQAGGVTLADLLGRTSALVPNGQNESAYNSALNIAYVLQDQDGGFQYELTASGSALLTTLTDPGVGSAVTEAIADELIEALASVITLEGNDALQALINAGFIKLNTNRDTAFNPTRLSGIMDYAQCTSAYINISSLVRIYDLISSADGAHRVCIGDEVYYIGSATMGRSSHDKIKVAGARSLSAGIINTGYSAGTWGAGTPFAGNSWETTWAICALAYAINNNPDSKFWARVETGGTGQYRAGFDSLYVFAKDGGDNHNIEACDEQMGDIRGDVAQYNHIVWYNDELEFAHSAGIFFNNGGKDWGTLKAVPTGYGTWGVQLHGKDVGKYRDLWILNVGPTGKSIDISTDPKTAYTGKGFGTYPDGTGITNLLALDRPSFFEIQNAADGEWAGAHVRTQSDAQEALDAVQAAIERKDKVRATLGAFINRLENTITNLEIQAENLQASESRISDVDLATEMTNFVKNQVLTQAAVSMLSQANSLPQLALSLLSG
jgi:flagellin-like hook-associated protein FlgL